MVLVGGTLLFAAATQVDTAQREQGDAQRQLSDISARFQRVRDEEQEIHHESALFADLQRHGIIGGEERLDWIEVLRNVRSRHQPAEMEYEFAPRQTIGTAGSYTFYRSPMDLQLKLVHEGELFALLAELRRTAHALLAVRHCQVQRLDRAPTDSRGISPQLEATCRLDWITAQETPS
jgi:hypothetical protein